MTGLNLRKPTKDGANVSLPPADLTCNIYEVCMCFFRLGESWPPDNAGSDQKRAAGGRFRVTREAWRNTYLKQLHPLRRRIAPTKPKARSKNCGVGEM